MKNMKTKNIGKIIAASIVSILFLSGMPGVLACDGWHEESPLYAGQDFENPIGNVEVTRECAARAMTVEYTTTGGWEITETHLAVTTSFDDIPQTGSGNPKVGKFPYRSEHDPAVTVVTYVIDLDDLFDGGPCEGTIYIAAHAVVQKLVGYDPDCNPIYDEETAWADTGYSFPGNSWALYFIIEI